MTIVTRVACFTVIAVMSAPARGQDLVPPSFDWSGFYAGLHLGHGWNRAGSYYDYTSAAFAPGSFQDVQSSLNGISGGVQFGHTWAEDNLIYGVEADFTLSGASLQANDTDPGIGAWTIENTLNGTATVRARIGYDFGNTVGYATAGLAAASLTTRQSLSIGGGGGPDPFQSDTNIHLGYALGVGLEHAISDTLSLRGEYMYLDFRDKNFAANYGDVTNSLSSHAFRIGLNYHF